MLSAMGRHLGQCSPGEARINIGGRAWPEGAGPERLSCSCRGREKRGQTGVLTRARGGRACASGSGKNCFVIIS